MHVEALGNFRARARTARTISFDGLLSFIGQDSLTRAAKKAFRELERVLTGESNLEKCAHWGAISIKGVPTEFYVKSNYDLEVIFDDPQEQPPIVAVRLPHTDIIYTTASFGRLRKIVRGKSFALSSEDVNIIEKVAQITKRDIETGMINREEHPLANSLAEKMEDLRWRGRLGSLKLV